MTAIPQPRKSPRQLRSQHTVETILQATARILATHGYAGTNTNLIAETAGVSVGSLYQYFPNKNALIAALHDRHDDQMLDVIDRVLDSNPAATLRELASAVERQDIDRRLGELRARISDGVPTDEDAAELVRLRARQRELNPRASLD